jgi:hypothetical protein
MRAPECNEKVPRSDCDKRPYSFAFPDPTLDPESLSLAHGSGVVLSRSTGLIDCPANLIETPRQL